MGKKILTFTMKEVDDNYEPVHKTEVTTFFSDEEAWDKMMPYFLHFLEGAGYRGVVNKMEELLGGSVYVYDTYSSTGKLGGLDE